MIKICHRANQFGPNPERENHPDYIQEALNNNLNVEIDVWFVEDKYILGHDEPQYEVNKSFICQHGLWLHAKNIPAIYNLDKLNLNDKLKFFFHDKDDCVLTSNGYFWTYPGIEITTNSIAVMPERVPGWDISQAAGVCTDFPLNY